MTSLKEDILRTLLVIFGVVLVSWAWKTISWIWLKPKKMEKYLKEQGLKGPNYKIMYGDINELGRLTEEACSKPMNSSHQIVPRVLPYYHQVVQQYGKMSYFWFGPIPRLIVMDPDMIKEILSDNSGAIGMPTDTPYRKLLVTGLVTYEGDKWAKHRKIISPAFHQDKLKMMLPAFATSCCEMINKWLNLTAEGGSCLLDVWTDLQNVTVDVISRTGFGSSYEEGRKIFHIQCEQTALFAQASQSIYIPGLRFLPTKINNRMKEIYSEVHTLLRDMILKRENAMKVGEAPNDLLGKLMESNFKEIKDGRNSKVGMTIDDVIEECKLFFFAGQETTASLLAWTLVALSMHQDWQQKAREEVMRVFGSNKPEYDGLNHLKVMTMILNEVLRLYPPFTTSLRETYKKIKVGDVILPRGVHLVLPTLLMHHDRELWGEDADEFKPERFLEGISKVTKNKVSFFPFGWGPRFCIGQNFAMLESKMALAMILQHFSFELSTTYVHAPYEVVTLQPQLGVQLVLHKI